MKGKNPGAAQGRHHNKLAEQWMPVPGFGDHYEASSLGRIRTKAREVHKRTRHGGVMVQQYEARLLNPSIEKGYQRVHIGYAGKKKKAWVHSLVLRAFCREPLEGEICRHLNGVKDDNRPENLAWGTHEENMADRKTHGNYKAGSEHIMAKITDDQVAFIRNSPLTGAAIGRLFDISQSQISRIRRGTSRRASE